MYTRIEIYHLLDISNQSDSYLKVESVINIDEFYLNGHQ